MKRNLKDSGGRVKTLERRELIDSWFLVLAEARSLVLGHSGCKKGGLTMTLEQFIRKNRRQIDMVIKRTSPKVKPLNDAERKVWMLNEMSLLLWVEAQGVKIDGEWDRRYSYDSFLSRFVRGEEPSNQK